MDPVGARQDVGRIEVQAEQRGCEILGAVGQLDRPPRRHERRVASHLDAVGHRGQRGVQRAALEARSPQEHPGVVHQVGFVDHHEGAAVPHLHGQRRLHAVERADRSGRIQLLGAVLARVVGRDPPGAGIVSQGKFGQFVADLERAEPGLLGNLIPERHPVVEGAHPQGEPAGRRGGFQHPDRQLVVLVMHARHLAPWLGPPLIVRLPERVGDAEPVAERWCSLELEAEQRRQDHRAPVAGQAVVELPVAGLHGDGVAAVR